MTTILFDIETDGLIPEMTKIHCIAAYGLETKEHYFADTTQEIEELLDILKEADTIIAHNSIGFDIIAIKKMYPAWEATGQVLDTLVLSRCIWTNLADVDYKRLKTGEGNLPSRLIGWHSLEAWGYRLGELKGEFGKQDNAWDVYTPEMKDYCIQDVKVLTSLYKLILSKNPTQAMLDLEHGFATIIQRQMDYGIMFDEPKAIELMLRLRERKEELHEQLKSVFPTRVIPKKYITPSICKVRSKRYPGLEKGMIFCKIQYQEFNPNSAQHIADRFTNKYNWKPTKLTPSGVAQMDEEVLTALSFPEAKILYDSKVVTKLLSQLADGNKAWLKYVKEGRIHGRVNTGGTVSGRCTHSSPNIAQVPSVRAAYGTECRALFRVPNNKTMVGCDASALELRCLAHYLTAHDGGTYAKLVLEGDIHTENQKAAKLETRDQAKTFIYGWIYGAGSAKIGEIVGGGAKEGNKLKKAFLKKFPQIAELTKGVKEKAGSVGVLKGLDGRKIIVRSPHSALNFLLQSAGALLMKQALIELDNILSVQFNLIHGDHYEFIINCHDEWQMEVVPEYKDVVMKASEEALIKAGEYFNFRVPIEGEATNGRNWSETH